MKNEKNTDIAITVSKSTGGIAVSPGIPTVTSIVTDNHVCKHDKEQRPAWKRIPKMSPLPDDKNGEHTKVEKNGKGEGLDCCRFSGEA